MLKWSLGFGGAMIALLTSLPNAANAQNKVATKDGEIIVATAQHYALLAQYKEMVGVVQATAPNMITLRVPYNHPTKNPAAPPVNTAADQQFQQQMQQLQQQMAAVRNIKNPAQAQQKAVQIQGQMAQLQAQHNQQKAAAAAKAQVMSKDFIDYELTLIESASIRKMQGGIEYDEAGNAKPAPPAEKGLVGQAAKFEDLTKGDDVRVYFTPAAKKANTPPARPQIRMVVIVKDAAIGASPNKK